MQKLNTKNSNKVTVVNNESAKLQRYEAAKLKKEATKETITETTETIEKKPKKMSVLVEERKVIKNDIMNERYKLSFNLNAIKERADNYIALLESEYKVTINKDELFNLRAPSFTPYLTENQVKAQANNGNRWTVSMVLILIAKYIKNK
jgi:hypothetical protein